MPKPCDACQGSNAVVYCRADAAYLCYDCDANVHGANKLASRHERVLMCEVCELTPAVVTCKADAAALCVACDTDIHSANPLARRHERVPVQPFFECPAVVKVTSVLNETEVDGPECLLKEEEDSSVASWLLPNPKVLDAAPPLIKCGGLVVVAEEGINSGGLSSTPLPEPEFHQLAKSEKEKASGKAKHEHPGAGLFSDVDPYLDLDYASAMGSLGADSLVPVHHSDPDALSPTEGSHGSASLEAEVPSSKSGYNYATASLSHSMSSSSLEAGVVPDSSMSEMSTSYDGARGMFDFPPRIIRVGQMEPMAREARVLRYREKRKNRKFEKTIRYASRKAYAESRPRVKGRFAKRTDSDSEQMYSLVPDGNFGIVPSF